MVMTLKPVKVELKREQGSVIHWRIWTRVETLHGTLGGNYAFTEALHVETITTASLEKDLHPYIHPSISAEEVK